MQHLFMMATMIRENQLRKMAKEIMAGLISVEQAMVNYNVSSKEAVINRVESLKGQIKRQTPEVQSETVNLDVMAA
jgi:nitrogen fixation protein FixH